MPINERDHQAGEWVTALLSQWIPEARSLPPEFWEHLGAGLRELGLALELLGEHLERRSSDNPWLVLYESFMEGHRRVGRE